MMANDVPLEEDGEARLRNRSRALWRYSAIGVIVAFIVTALSGVAVEQVRSGILPMAALVGFWLLAVGAYAWFTRDFLRRIDEFDLMDNLWATTAAFYAFLIAAISWIFFHDAQLVGPPNTIVLVAFSLAVLFIAYGLRKLGWR